VHAEDLYLAFACARGDPKAHAELDALYLERVERELRRKPMLAPFAQDAIQRLRQKLLVGGEGGGPKLLDYAGAGPLLALVRAAALRQAINLRRARLSSGKQVPVDESTSLLSPDPELAFLKAHYREPFQAAFREALAALSDEMVNVLRLHLVDGLNIDRIGALYGAHRATAARWIAATRRELLEGTRARLAARLRLGAGEVDSLLRLLCSQLDLSLRGALAGGAA
jgi:RNA polymerase sigma-70 factor (ECF subfamily)